MTTLCACNCGNEAKPGNRYINGHNTARASAIRWQAYYNRPQRPLPPERVFCAVDGCPVHTSNVTGCCGYHRMASDVEA